MYTVFCSLRRRSKSCNSARILLNSSCFSRHLSCSCFLFSSSLPSVSCACFALSRMRFASSNMLSTIARSRLWSCGQMRVRVEVCILKLRQTKSFTVFTKSLHTFKTSFCLFFSSLISTSACNTANALRCWWRQQATWTSVYKSNWKPWCIGPTRISHQIWFLTGC